MNQLKKLKDDIDTVIYHNPCMDGFGAAHIAAKYFKDTHKREVRLAKPHIGDAARKYLNDEQGGKVLLVPTHISDTIDESLYIGKTVLMVDILTPDYLKIKEKAKNLIILDHHKTNQKDLGGCDFAYFDMNKSGVGIIWEYFYDDTPMPLFLQCIQDRDIWTWIVPESKYFCDGFYKLFNTAGSIQEQIRFFDEMYDLQSVDGKLLSEKFNYYYTIGEVLYKIKMSSVKKIVKHSEPNKVQIGTDSYNVSFFNCTTDYASDLGNYAVSETDCDFAVLWSYDHEDEQYRYSLRSIDSKVDVSAIAKRFGGGGHRNAAGCASKMHPKELFHYEPIDESESESDEE